MKNYIKKYTSIVGFLITNGLLAEKTININLIPYPLTKKDVSTMIKEVEKPGRMPKAEMDALLRPAPVNGIFISYYGFIDASDSNGLISFARRTPAPHIDLIITKEVRPIYTFGNTVHHWELKNNNAELFKIRKEFDAQTKTSYWEVKKDSLPEKKIIPLEAVILFANPEDVYVPEGITINKESGENLFIPPFYIKKDINLVGNVLETLNVTHLLRPEKKEIKKEGAVVQEQVNEAR